MLKAGCALLSRPTGYGLNNLFNLSGSFIISNEADRKIFISISNATVTATTVPLLPTVWLLGSGLLGLAGWRRLKKG